MTAALRILASIPAAYVCVHRARQMTVCEGGVSDRAKARGMDFFRRLFGESKAQDRADNDAVASAIEALDEGAAHQPLPTLVCRDCGLQYENTGTYLRGSRCPQCHPSG